MTPGDAYSNFHLLFIRVADGIATVTLNEPDRRNALSRPLQLELERFWREVAHDETVGAIVLTGAGTVFSAGGDIKAMAERFGTQAAVKFAIEVASSYRRLLQTMLEVNQPIIAAINGDAIGLGGTLAVLCDIGVIAETAKFGDPHIHLGLSAGDGAAAVWPMMVGFARAKERILRGTLMSGREAQQLGFFNHCVPAADVVAKAAELAHELAALPRSALRMSKHAINKHLKFQLDQILDTALAWEMMTMATADHHEAVQAFIAKRKPQFRTTSKTGKP